MEEILDGPVLAGSGPSLATYTAYTGEYAEAEYRSKTVRRASGSEDAIDPVRLSARSKAGLLSAKRKGAQLIRVFLSSEVPERNPNRKS